MHNLCTSFAPTRSSYSLVCCRHCYPNDCIPTTSVQAPSPLAKITKKRVERQYTLMARQGSTECPTANIRAAGIVQHVWNVMAHEQKPDLVFHGKGRVHLNRRGSQFSRLLTAEVCASAVVMVVMLDTPCSEVEWKTTGYPLHSPVSPSLPLPCVTVYHQVSTELYHQTLYHSTKIEQRHWYLFAPVKK